MKSLDEFKNFFDREMLPHLEVLEQRRLKMMKRAYSVFFISLLIILAIGLLYIYVGSKSQDDLSLWYILAGVITVIVAIIMGVTWAKDKGFYSDFKTHVIARIVKFVGPDLNYEPNNHVGSDSFERSRIFLKGVDRFTGDDRVHGMIGRTQIWFSEVKAEYKTTTTDGKGNTKTTWQTIFKGMFFIADFNKHFQTCTVVLPNRTGNGFIGRMLQKMNLARREKLVKLEDPEFNKHFVVYGEDQVEARYVLSTSLMRRITEFQNRNQSQLFLSFVNSFLYVAIAYSRNLFEPSYFKKLTNFDMVKEYFLDIHLAVSIVEELNLNNRIWTKE
jgi:hypothetical protein